MSSASDASPEREAHPPTEYLQGIMERVTYHSEESGYTVARFKVPSARDLVTIVGHFPSITAGQTLRLTGFWRDHPKYGPQFQVTHAQREVFNGDLGTIITIDLEEQEVVVQFAEREVSYDFRTGSGLGSDRAQKPRP